MLYPAGSRCARQSAVLGELLDLIQMGEAEAGKAGPSHLPILSRPPGCALCGAPHHPGRHPPLCAEHSSGGPQSSPSDVQITHLLREAAETVSRVPTIHCGTYALKQFPTVKGFQECCMRTQLLRDARVKRRCEVHTAARDHENLRRRIFLSKLGDEFKAVSVRHVHVGDHKIKAIAFKEFYCFVPTGNCCHRVPVIGKHLPNRFEKWFRIIGDEDA